MFHKLRKPVRLGAHGTTNYWEAECGIFVTTSHIESYRHEATCERCIAGKKYYESLTENTPA